MCVAFLAISGCISNDIPFPVVVPNITSMEVENAESVEIDSQNRTVTVHMAETADLRAVSIISVKFDNDITTVSSPVEGVHDLTEPLKVTLTTYGTGYEWSIVARREIERYFTVAGQIGSSAIDPVNCRAIAKVGKKALLTKVEVTSLKLGPEGLTEYSLDPSQMRDFTHGITLEVTAFGLTEVWNLYVENSEQELGIQKINPWTCEAYVTSLGMAGVENGFLYRAKESETWLPVDEADITADGGTFIAHIRHLTPETTYEVMSYCGEVETPVKEFTTDAARQLPNSSFEYVSKVTGREFYKFYDPNCGVEGATTKFWASGNGDEETVGSIIPGSVAVITVPDESDKVDGNRSVCAQSQSAYVTIAAGNLFTGQFVQTVGTSGGIVNFGRPWTSRPTALRMWCKYKTGTMNYVSGDLPSDINLTKDKDYDRAQIKVALGTWTAREYKGSADCPVKINTTDPSTFVDFYTDKSTIANGDIIIYNDGYQINRGGKTGSATNGWVQYTIPITYRDTEKYPTHIIISCAASQYGDYFTGSTSSRLWLDKFELIYE